MITPHPVAFGQLASRLWRDHYSGRVREGRRPRMPNEIGPHLEQRIVAFALAHPGLGPRRISAELARQKWGGIRISSTATGACSDGWG